MEFDFTNAGLIQADRILRISTSLGTDVLLAEKVDIREEVNGLFEIHVDVKSKRTDIKPEELVGTVADISLEIAYGQRRPWNGLITGFREGPPVSRGLRSYRLVIRPQLWLLSQRSDCRIWMNKTTVQIVKILLSEHGIKAAVTGGVISPPAPIHYSVQWNETDLAYLTRRLEFDGLFYWFEHTDGQHTLHVASHPFGYTEGPDTDVRFAAGSTDRNHIAEFTRDYQFTPGRRAGGDWNFEKPQGPQGAVTPSLVSLPKNAEYELFHYPSKAMDQSSNDLALKLRMQAVEADHEKIEGNSTVRTLAAGRKFKPYDVAHPDHAFEPYVITAIIHQIVDHSYETIEDGKLDYSNSFIALPARLPATPHRVTPQPRIDGSQVAIVAGPDREEIHPDEYGRIKVWFPWQRKRAVKDGSDTCWIRVMQSWAGGGFGAQVIPRIGMEVMVTYLEGDPDRPVVTGIVPNPSTKVPYKLPENKTKSVIRSNSHKAAGHNEISLEDEKGEEELFLHAQKNMATRVLNNKVKRIDQHDVESIGGNRNTEIQKNRQEKIHGSLNQSVGGGGSPLMAMLGNIVAVGGKDSINGSAAVNSDMVSQFANSVAAMGAGSELASLAANSAFGSAGEHRTEAGKQQTSKGSTIGNLLSVLMPMSGIVNSVIEKFRSDTIGLARTEQIGLYKNTSVGHTMTINIGEEFIIKCGESKLMMDKKGNVTITGTKFNFAASGHVQINGKIVDIN
ncbi:type VI secretion system Vgr family protein [Phyllobacterium meliloti]|uniref:type VI secretion system Vgr family protein n=1 Tax=Phyllobacterium meliloti TaxID=555317 RepID=UPI001D148D52|nr:type VI secretion system tip protein TssI/VgrG [Phyllobacterium sp. T1293]UGX87050.1 type VI secretion system tip protein VgrG [Phyllobacterium sp. T1293]